MRVRLIVILAFAGVTSSATPAPPVIDLVGDDLRVSQSCRIRVGPSPILDANDDGVIHVDADDVEIVFEPGAALHGCEPGTLPDAYRGYAIRVAGRRNVTIRNARISGFWCAVWATRADGLVLDGIDASDNRRDRLYSTPEAEDGRDWLWPHENDANEWLARYGAAIYVEDARDAVVRDCRVQRGQNALVLDRVAGARVYDNDFSFNSGWGIALWRACGNVISRNAIDFCVRGYSHGVYNRGQDSAGILMFEQCDDNVIAYNSVTHGGDGFFGFAGLEALGERRPAQDAAPPDSWYRRRGNRRNLLLRNDFSYAPAHGIEMTFSFDNQFVENRIVGNAICGIWAGYCHDTLIVGNEIADNGEAGYRLQRGGVNIEHGRANHIVRNAFARNACAVHLWWDPDEGLLDKPWTRANGTASTRNVVSGNRYDADALGLHLRGPGDVILEDTHFRRVTEPMQREEQAQIVPRPADLIEPSRIEPADVPGTRAPVGARPQLRGREQIIMTPWGPWDHASPLVRLAHDTGDEAVYELHAMDGPVQAACDNDAVSLELAKPDDRGVQRCALRVAAPGVYPYRLKVSAGDFVEQLGGLLVAAQWDATFFAWPPETDPRERLDAWRALADTDAAVGLRLKRIDLPFGNGAPRDLASLKFPVQAVIGREHFGLIARTSLRLPAGRWRFVTYSDDGVRVLVDGRPLIENWTHHVPTRDEAILEVPSARDVHVEVEYFEITGYATLQLRIELADPIPAEQPNPTRSE